MMRAAALAGLAFEPDGGRQSPQVEAGRPQADPIEDGMQDWPIEVATRDRMMDFLGLLEGHRNDWELTFWFLDLVLESARERADLDAFATKLLETVVSAVAATRAPSLMSRLEYWACPHSPLDEAFEVSPIAREALLRLA
jgi:hypothetical protein